MSERILFNGVKKRGGGYLFDSVTMAEISAVAQGQTLDTATRQELEFKARSSKQSHFGLKAGIDPRDLSQTGWGVIFPAVDKGSQAEKEQLAIYEALEPLRMLRQQQASAIKANRYKEFRGVDAYRRGETKQAYLGRLGSGPGAVDPDKLPYYLLIVGDPASIPFRVQYQIDVQYAVGRIHFDRIEDYYHYAVSVVAAETQQLAMSRRAVFFGALNPDDGATQLAHEKLIVPLSQYAEQDQAPNGWTIERYLNGAATTRCLSDLLNGTQAPALLFSSSHGMGFDPGDPLQRVHQGALLCQDWKGPSWHKDIPEDWYFSGDKLKSDSSLLGMIAFNFACFGAGTPEKDDFSAQAFKDRPSTLSPFPFVADLPRRMLSLPKGGALATIGHVDRAWDCSFRWQGSGRKSGSDAQLAVFESTLKLLMEGNPVGYALECFNERYAELASDLSVELEDVRNGKDPDDYLLSSLWTSSNDARGYAIVGDPAVRLNLAGEKVPEKRREQIDLSAVSSSNPLTALPTDTVADPGDQPPTASSSFGVFGFGKTDEEVKDASAPPAPGLLQTFAKTVVDTLSTAVANAASLEVKTYVSAEIGQAVGNNLRDLEQNARLRAYTRIALDGDMIVCVPETAGQVDGTLWGLHLEMVKQAQAHRAEMISMALSAVQNLLK